MSGWPPSPCSAPPRPLALDEAWARVSKLHQPNLPLRRAGLLPSPTPCFSFNCLVQSPAHVGGAFWPFLLSFVSLIHSTLDIPSHRHTTASVSCSSFSPFLLLIYNLPVVPFRHPFPLQLPRGSEARTSYPIAYARGIHLPCDLFANACCAEGQRQWHLGFGPVLGCLPDGQEGAEHHSLP